MVFIENIKSTTQESRQKIEKLEEIEFQIPLILLEMIHYCFCETPRIMFQRNALIAYFLRKIEIKERKFVLFTDNNFSLITK